MNWLDRAERKFGHLGIAGLPQIVAGLSVLVFVLCQLNPVFANALILVPELVMQGEVWRLVTFLLVPRFGGYFPDWLSFVFYVMYILFIGGSLERAMGSFRFTLFYFLGALGQIAAAFFFGGNFGTGMLNLSLLFAFVRYDPDATMYVMFIIPMRAKWIAAITFGLLALNFFLMEWDYRFAMLAAFLNYFVFFGAEHVRAVRERREVSGRHERFRAQAQREPAEFLHECVICKRNDATSPELEFRVARDGQEYCREHLPVPPPAG